MIVDVKEAVWIIFAHALKRLINYVFRGFAVITVFCSNIKIFQSIFLQLEPDVYVNTVNA